MTKILLLLFALFSVISSLSLESHEAMVPGVTNTVKCDGNTGKCKMQLQFGGNNYWAVWDALITPNPPQ